MIAYTVELIDLSNNNLKAITNHQQQISHGRNESLDNNEHRAKEYLLPTVAGNCNYTCKNTADRKYFVGQVDELDCDKIYYNYKSHHYSYQRRGGPTMFYCHLLRLTTRTCLSSSISLSAYQRCCCCS